MEQWEQSKFLIHRSLLARPEVGDELADGGVDGHREQTAGDSFVESVLEVLFHRPQFLTGDGGFLDRILWNVWHTPSFYSAYINQ